MDITQRLPEYHQISSDNIQRSSLFNITAEDSYLHSAYASMILLIKADRPRATR